jgi:autotransporter-associated beta strand protein
MSGTLPTRDNNIAGNAITLIGDATVSTGSWQAIGINMALRGARTFNISSGITFLNGQLSDDTSAGAIIKSGGAELLLGGSNTISAPKRLTLNNGTVTLENPAALGAAAVNTIDRSIEFGTGANTSLQIRTNSPANTHNLGGGSTSATTTISLGRKTAGPGHVQNFGSLDAGSRTIAFNQGTNVTSGGMVVNIAEVRLTAGNNDRPMTLAGTATMTVAGASITSTPNTKRLQLDGTSASNTIGTISNGITGATLQLIKANTGTWTLSGNNSHTGTTTVSAGTLVINGNQSNATGAVTVNGGATLSGIGTLGGAVSVLAGGTIAPGLVGTLTADSSMTLDGRLAIAVDGVTAARLAVTGNLNITGATLDFNVQSGGVTASGYVIATFGSLTGTAFTAVANLPQGYQIFFDLADRQIRLVKTAGYQDWIGNHTVTDPAAAADPDGDGLSNLIEYVLGGDPSTSSATLAPTARISGADLVFSFLRDDDSETADIVLTVEAGHDMATWPEIFTIGADSATSSPGVRVEENAAAADTVVVTISTGGFSPKYARMKVRMIP